MLLGCGDFFGFRFNAFICNVEYFDIVDTPLKASSFGELRPGRRKYKFMKNK